VTTTFGNPAVRRAGTLVAALFGANLLYLAAYPKSSAAKALIFLLAGIAFFAA
jgi:hypothetical protein